MYKLKLTIKKPCLKEENFTLETFENKNDVNEIIKSFEQKKLLPYYKVIITEEVLNFLNNKNINLLKNITIKNKIYKDCLTEYKVFIIDEEKKEELLYLMQTCPKRTMSQFYFSVKSSIKQTILKNDLENNDLNKKISKIICKNDFLFHKNTIKFTITELKIIK